MARRKREQSGPALDPRWVIAGLLLLAATATGARILYAAWYPSAARGTAWRIHLRYDLRTTHARDGIALALPWDSPAVQLFSQEIAVSGLKLQRGGHAKSPAHRLVADTRGAGSAVLEANFIVRVLAEARPRHNDKTRLSSDERHRYLAAQEGIDPRDPAVTTHLDRISAGKRTPGGMPAQILDYARNQIAYSTHGPASAAAALKRARGNDVGRARAAVALCRAAGFPARVVTGFVLDDDSPRQPRHWVEVYNAGRWQALDPTSGHEAPLPPSYVAFSRDGPLLLAQGTHFDHAVYDIHEDSAPLGMAGQTTNPLAILDLSRLSFSARTTLATLLLLPLGALLNAFVKTAVGVQTYGTFTPAMLALAAAYVDWLTAAVIFVVVAVIGLCGRSLLPNLGLTRSPRLTIVFTLIALAMALAVSIMAYFNALSGAPLVLLPIVILTTLIDRIYSVADERGTRVALVRMFWTLLTALGCFFILNLEDLGELLVSYPELHLVTIAMVVALLRYRGPTLLDHPLLHWLGETTRAPRTPVD